MESGDGVEAAQAAVEAGAGEVGQQVRVRTGPGLHFRVWTRPGLHFRVRAGPGLHHTQAGQLAHPHLHLPRHRTATNNCLLPPLGPAGRPAP